MKKKKVGIIILSLALLLSACSNGKDKEVAVKEELVYSNLVDKESQKEVRELLESKGIEKDKLDLFFEKVDYYNKNVGEKNLVDKGFKKIDSYEIEYDEVKLFENWNKENPMYIGNNCRITSYDLLRDLIDVDLSKEIDRDNLFMDKDALDNDSIEYDDKYLSGFESLFGNIDTENTKDIDKHIENIEKEWNNRGIKFKTKDGISLISVFMHDDMDSVVFIGHAGVLVEDGDKLVFIEKVSFDMPYQVLKFNNRTELNDYLMAKYDISYDQEFAKPFIFENNKLLEEYRGNPKNIEKE